MLKLELEIPPVVCCVYSMAVLWTACVYSMAVLWTACEPNEMKAVQSCRQQLSPSMKINGEHAKLLVQMSNRKQITVVR